MFMADIMLAGYQLLWVMPLPHRMEREVGQRD